MANEPGSAHKTPSIVWPILIVVGTLFLTGIAMGYLQARIDRGDALLPPAAGAAIMLLIGALCMTAYIQRLGVFWRDWSSRKRTYWASLAGAAVLGLASSVLLRGGGTDVTGALFYSDSALPPTIAIALALLWVLGLSVSMSFYHRSVDDHEERAWLWAGLVGWYAFILPAPAWWVLHRADLAPPVDAMWLFIFSMAVNAAVYLWLKFR